MRGESNVYLLHEKLAKAQIMDDEIEALQAIYDADFKAIPEGCEIRICGTLDSSVENHVEAFVQFHLKHSKQYPQEKLTTKEVSVRSTKGLGEEDALELCKLIIDESAKQIGQPMVFSLVEVAKEWLAERNYPRSDDMYSQMQQRERDKQREKEKQANLLEQQATNTANTDNNNNNLMGRKLAVIRNDGTPVTLESFTNWLAKYKKETKEGSENVDDAAAAQVLSGRQIFEGGNVKQTDGLVDEDELNEDEEELDDDDDDGDGEEEEQGETIDKQVFLQEKDVDLDSLSD